MLYRGRQHPYVSEFVEVDDCHLCSPPSGNDCGLNLLELVASPWGEHHVRAECCECFGEGTTKAVTGASDDDETSVEAEVSERTGACYQDSPQLREYRKSHSCSSMAIWLDLSQCMP